MDPFTVDVEREAPPAWAKPQTDIDAGGVRKATQPQLNYIRDLIGKKNLSLLKPEERDALVRIQDEEDFWTHNTTRLSFEKARKVLDRLIPLPYKPREEQKVTQDDTERIAVGVPPGRYAVDADNGELRFYVVWQSRDKKRMNVYVCHGPDESSLKFHKTMLGVLKKIKKVGIREAALRYGMEIGECSNCGRRLTNRISRELAIGPICGGRMFGEDEWKTEVKAKRAEIVARGEDPDEELE